MKRIYLLILIHEDDEVVILMPFSKMDSIKKGLIKESTAHEIQSLVEDIGGRVKSNVYALERSKPSIPNSQPIDNQIREFAKRSACGIPIHAYVSEIDSVCLIVMEEKRKVEKVVKSVTTTGIRLLENNRGMRVSLSPGYIDLSDPYDRVDLVFDLTYAGDKEHLQEIAFGSRGLLAFVVSEDLELIFKRNLIEDVRIKSKLQMITREIHS